MKSVRLANVLVLLGLVAVTSFVRAGDWPHFRGPSFNGSTDETNLPSRWSLTENIAWTAELPGPAASTPIVWKDHVFVSGTDPDTEMLKALCFDRRTGKLLWQHDVSKGLARMNKSNYASPSPTTDGEIVVFFYGNGDLLGFNFAGKKLWSRNIQKDYGSFAFLWTFASSPLLYDGRLYLQVLQRDTAVGKQGFKDKKNESYLLAMNPKTGKTLWQQKRPSRARAESREAFTSPIAFERDGKKSFLVIGGDALTAHDAATGKELWRWGTWNPDRIGHWRHVPSPVASEDVILVCAPKNDPVYAIKAGGSGKRGDDAVAWISRDVPEVTSDVPTPAYYQGDFFILSDKKKTLSRVEPKTGKVMWKLRTPGLPKYEASPLVADGKIYIVNFAGDVVVVDAENGKVISEIAMKATGEANVRSSIVASQGQLFIRTNRKLFCVGKK